MPQCCGKTITMIMFAYLAIVTVIFIITARPFESAKDLEFGMLPQTVFASVQTVVLETPSVQDPAAPYIIIEPAN